MFCVAALADMSGFRVRPMMGDEFTDFRARTIREYAAEQVGAGNWSSTEAEQLATKETDELLPAGIDTPGMLLLVGEVEGAGVVGVVWLELHHRRTSGSWIYDLQVDAEQRGRGYGRALLLAAEHETRKRGINSIALNVFGGNVVARKLYESSGFEAAQLMMRKALDRGPREDSLNATPEATSQ
jgi:GNAT superfamily N-acetyltransferase